MDLEMPSVLVIKVLTVVNCLLLFKLLVGTIRWLLLPLLLQLLLLLLLLGLVGEEEEEEEEKGLIGRRLGWARWRASLQGLW